METNARYLQTIENLMVENSRLTKELADAVKGKLPSRIISEEIADQCYHKIASVIGPVAKGSLLDEVSVLCNEFVKVGREFMSAVDTLKKREREIKAIEQTTKGEDIEENYNPTPLVNNVSRIRGVLEVMKVRLDRLVASGNTDVVDMRNDLARFLNGGKNE